LPHFTDPAERLALLGLLGRAAGGLGDRSAFEAAVDEARVLLLRASTEEAAALSLLGFAHGAASLGDTELAAELAQRAITLATRRSEWRVAMEAEAVAESAASRRSVAAASSNVKGEPLHVLATAFVDALTSPVAVAA
ncbi:MAG: hypothetical protein ACJ8J0_28285, partial [Longimicrobiaceae bacterium]